MFLNIRDSLKQALRNGLIERNPVSLAQLPKQTEKGTKQAMTKEQQALFMEYAKESYLYNFFAVLLRTGMRSGELRALIYSPFNNTIYLPLYSPSAQWFAILRTE